MGETPLNSSWLPFKEVCRNLTRVWNIMVNLRFFFKFFLNSKMKWLTMFTNALKVLSENMTKLFPFLKEGTSLLGSFLGASKLF